MGTRDKLLSMTDGLRPKVPTPQSMGEAPPPTGNASSEARFPELTPGRPPARTGPGQMLQFRGEMMQSESRNQRLEERLKLFEGSEPSRSFDPAVIEPSKWANRHPDAFKSAAFLRFKDEIKASGGNVQAILIRPIAGREGHYEIVFGSRRHRACSELGLQVKASVVSEDFSDLDLFATMDRENRERADLSPYEQGAAYRRALDEGLYPSARRLAEALGVSHTWVNNTLEVADLPPAVVRSFPSPLTIQHRHARHLRGALETDRKGVLRRAEKLAQMEKKPSPQGVVDTLSGARGVEADSSAGAIERPLTVAGRSAGRVTRTKTGALTLKLESWTRTADGIDPDALKVAVDALVALAGSPVAT
jgi:ParB family chromosome partitioning protein